MPTLTKDYYINFYGGEPLLCFNLIKKTTSLLNSKNKEFKKRGLYSITTNGSLFTEEIFQFLNKHKFSIELSFDGLVQDVQRKQGSFKNTVSSIKKLLNYPGIDLEVNSVFTHETVGCLSESIKFIMDLGVPGINFSISVIQSWNKNALLKLEEELAKLSKIILSHYKRDGNVPIKTYTRDLGKGIYYCAAGKDRFAVSSDGGIWGCDLFADYFKGKEKSPEYKKYYFGDLDIFIKNHERIYHRIFPNYARLSMDNFSTPSMKCFLCPEIEDCTVCPVNAAFSGGPFGWVPSYVCKIQKIKIREKKALEKELQKISSK